MNISNKRIRDWPIMNIRPRCYEWLPLSTQQLRLRNLQAIHAVNIDHPLLMALEEDPIISAQMDHKIVLYYSLHHQLNTDAFYSSDCLPYRVNLNYKWSEIQSMNLIKSNSRCVCIKIWARFQREEAYHKKIEPETSSKLSFEEEAEEENGIYHNLTQNNSVNVFQENTTNIKDRLLFSWGVYFSGLMPVCLQTDMTYNSNTLIFKINDGYFASPNSCTLENLRSQLSSNCKTISNNNDSKMKYSIPIPNDQLSINSPPVSRSSSPVPVNWHTDLHRICTKRYLQLDCERSQIRQSYNLEKLLKIQEKQRDRLKLQQICKEISDDIRNLSVHCVTKDQLLTKNIRLRTISSGGGLSNGSLLSYSHHNQQYHQHYFSSPSQHHSMGRTLSLLLGENFQLEPKQLFQAQKLHRELESLRCRKRILLNAHITITESIKEQNKLLEITTSKRKEVENTLNRYQKQLVAERLEYLDKCNTLLELRQRKWILTQQIKHRIASLCIGLDKIYPIDCNQLGYHTISGVPFLSLEIYAQDMAYIQSFQYAEKINPMSLSAALGYLAHLVRMLAVIINIPLRNVIIYDASRSSILDTIRNFPTTPREFPLYGRSSIPTKAVKYAICLLNQNIAQLCYDITNKRCDRKSTIENLRIIFKTMYKWNKVADSKLHANLSNTRENTQINDCSVQSQSNTINCEPKETRQSESEHLNSVSNCNDITVAAVDGRTHTQECLDLPRAHSLLDLNIKEVEHPTSSNLSLADCSNHLMYCAKHNLRTTTEISGLRSAMTQPQRICRSEGSNTDSEEECHSVRVQRFRNSDSVLTEALAFNRA